MNIESIRDDFPILGRSFNGKMLAYLDNAATTQKPVQVIEAIAEYYSKSNANIHRGAYALAEESTEKYEASRKNIADFVGAKPEEIIFTRNATESLNLVANVVCEHDAGKRGRKRNSVLLTKMEHHSNIVSWQLAARKNKMKLEYVNLDGVNLDEDDFEKKIDARHKIFSFTQISNVTGNENDAPSLCRKGRKNGVLTCVDATQAVPHKEVDVNGIGCDFLVFSGHKMLGPTGIGVLYMKKKLQEEMGPFLGGGDMIKTVGLQKSTWNRPPYKFEAGTPNIADVVGLSAAVDYLKGIGMDEIERYEKMLSKYCRDALGNIPGIRFHGDRRDCGIVSFNVGKIHAHDISQFADREGVAIRAGHHCAQPFMKELGEVATARASAYIYNTEEEIDRLASSVKTARAKLG